MAHRCSNNVHDDDRQLSYLVGFMRVSSLPWCGLLSPRSRALWRSFHTPPRTGAVSKPISNAAGNLLHEVLQTLHGMLLLPVRFQTTYAPYTAVTRQVRLSSIAHERSRHFMIIGAFLHPHVAPPIANPHGDGSRRAPRTRFGRSPATTSIL